MKISVIIITLNEVENIKSTIESVKRAAKFGSGTSIPIEIIVSDGGSTDGTILIAENMADKVIKSSRGRYKQLNAGAGVSKGNVLLFLHADTLLPKDALVRIIHSLRDPRINGGGFKKYCNWNKNTKRSNFIKSVSFLWQFLDNWFISVSKNIPGDNGMFFRKKIFEKLNGFSSLWICEDLDILRRLKQFGKKNIVFLPSPVLTSTRRIEKYGFLKIISIWFLIGLFWRLGMPQEKIRNLFRKYSTVPEHVNNFYLRF